jgi:hypothetical protein
MDKRSWQHTTLTMSFKFSGFFVVENISPEKTSELYGFNLFLLTLNCLTLFFKLRCTQANSQTIRISVCKGLN